MVLLLAAGLLCLLPLAVSDGPGVPCVVRGNVTFDGVPVDGADVVSSLNTTDVSFNGGNYGVDMLSGTSGLWIVATYQGHSGGVNLSRTPDGGGFMYQDIAILSGASSPTAGPSASPSAGPSGSASGTPTAGPTASPRATQPSPTAIIGPSSPGPSAMPEMPVSPQPVSGEPLLAVTGLIVTLVIICLARGRQP